MSVPTIIRHTGVLTAQTSASAVYGAGPVDTSFYATYATHKSGQIDVVGATVTAQPLELENVVKVRVIAMSITGNSGTLVLTSARGATQQIPLSTGGQYLQHFPTVGDEVTAIAFKGDGVTVTYFIAGDAS